MNSEILAQRQQRLIRLFNESAPIAQSMGMTLRYNEKGQAIFEMPHNPRFDHALDGIHGGVIATLLDNAGWFTVAPNFDHWIATIEFSTRLHEPVAKTDLYSIGRIVRIGKRLASAEMEVRTAKDRLIATGSGTFTVTSVPLDPS